MRQPPALQSGATTSTPGPAPVAERRLVTVLFVDLVGYTTLAEGKDPEAAREILSAFNETARRLIAGFGDRDGQCLRTGREARFSVAEDGLDQGENGQCTRDRGAAQTGGYRR